MKSSTALQDMFDHLAENLVELNIKNKLFSKKQEIFRIDLNVNFDFNEYEKYTTKSYYFYDKWHFKHSFSKLFNARIIDIFIILEPIEHTPDHIHFLNRYLEDKICEPDLEEFLTFVQNECTDLSSSIYDYFHGKIVDNDSLELSYNFHIKGLEIIGISNNSHTLSYHGSVHTDEIAFDYAHSIFCILELTGSKANIPFFKQLLLESYSLILEDNFKMAFFNAFAAFESFVNITSCREFNAERLSDKFKIAFDTHATIPKFSSYDIYRQLTNNIDYYTELRNIIAHGRSVEDYYYDFDMQKAAKEMYIFSSITILCFEQGIKNLNELRKFLKSREIILD